jgi:hypothetical protein
MSSAMTTIASTTATIRPRDRRGRAKSDPSLGGVMRGSVVALPQR